MSGAKGRPITVIFHLPLAGSVVRHLPLMAAKVLRPLTVAKVRI